MLVSHSGYLPTPSLFSWRDSKLVSGQKTNQQSLNNSGRTDFLRPNSEFFRTRFLRSFSGIRLPREILRPVGASKRGGREAEGRCLPSSSSRYPRFRRPILGRDNLFSLYLWWPPTLVGPSNVLPSLPHLFLISIKPNMQFAIEV